MNLQQDIMELESLLESLKSSDLSTGPQDAALQRTISRMTQIAKWSMRKTRLKKAVGSVAAMLLLSALPGHAQDRAEPRVFTKVFSLEMGAAGIALAADGFTTEKNNRPSFKPDQNPLARPFVKSAGGNAAYFSMSFVGLVGANRLLRDHPRMRHALNWSVVAMESFEVYRNATALRHGRR
jgi:hypothetical protein